MKEKNKIYDRKYSQVEFDKILKLMQEKKFDFANSSFLVYLNKYKDDICAYIYYASLLIIIGDYEKAEMILNSQLLSTANLKEDIEKIFSLRIKLMIAMEKYEQCYDYIMNNLSNYEEPIDSILLLFLRKKINKESYVASDFQTYFEKQIVSYSESLFLEHTSKSLFRENKNKSKFSEDFPLQAIYFELRKRLPDNDIRKNEGTITNSYLFKYDGCGTIEDREVNYFKVITLANSNDITTIYPYDNKARNRYIDLNNFLEKNEEKVKTLSQVDKFKKRYQRNN